jgi:MFS transporter, PPP family, 3-phenylpropionic acid transporter
MVRASPLRVTQSTFGLVYAVEGTLLPFLPVLLVRSHGLGPGQVGVALAMTSVAAMVTPPLLAAWADGGTSVRRLVSGALVATAATVLLLLVDVGFWGLLLVLLVLGGCYEPVKSLLDGAFFAARTGPGGLAVGYDRVRLWGTVGFAVPAVVVLVLAGPSGGLESVPALACVLCLAGAALAWGLPVRRGPAEPRRRVSGTAALQLATAAVVRSGTGLVFVVAMFLLQAAMAVHVVFYPILATEVAGVPARWLGVLSTVGLVAELCCMVAFGALLRRWGWQRLMVVGAGAAGLRLALLAAVPTAAVVVTTQLLHGLVIIALLVGSRSLLDQLAGDGTRHALQGLYATVVWGGGRVVGTLLGALAAAAYPGLVFTLAAGTAVVAAVLLARCLHRDGLAVPIAAAHRVGSPGRTSTWTRTSPTAASWPDTLTARLRAGRGTGPSRAAAPRGPSGSGRGQ